MIRDDHAQLIAAATAARPGLDHVAFAEHLAAVAPPDGELAIADLALAFQAAHGDDEAIAALHDIVKRSARAALMTAGYPHAITDDALQETSILLLTGPLGERRPLLLTYQGRARLSTWIKTIALRTASRLTRVEKRAVSNEAVLSRLTSSPDPASDAVKAELRPTVRAAYVEAVRGLSYFQRELLADVILDGKTIDDLSQTHGVHRATAARWLGRARAALDDGLRRELGHALDLQPTDVSSVLDAVATNVELTPARLLDGVPGKGR